MKTKKLFINRTSIFLFAWVIMFGIITHALAQDSTPPQNSAVSKKIFARELAQALNLRVLPSKKCYKDLSLTDETTPFICALKKKKVFTGPTKLNFSPDASTTLSFAIKNVCIAQKWTKIKSVSACTQYARKHGLLDPSLPKRIPSKLLLSSGQLSQLFKKIQPLAQAGATNSTSTSVASENTSSFSTTLPPREVAQQNFTPVPDGTIAADFFANISLSAPLPTRFYKDEVYMLEGDLVGVSASDVFVFLCPEGQGCDKSVNFVEKTSGTHFKVPVHFAETGNFEIGLIPGRSGQSRVENISVMPSPPESAGGQAPVQLSVSYAEGKTTFRWNSSGNLTQLVIFQGTNRRDYFFRQPVQSFSPKSADFASFKNEKAGFAVIQDGTQSVVSNMTITTQELRTVDTKSIQIDNLQETFGAPGHFTFTGKALVPISKRAALILPNGKVQEIIFAKSDASAGASLSIETDLPSPGTYIFEVNTPQGNAVINVPVYVGSAIPLLPDFFSLNPGKLSKTPINDLNQARQQLLDLVNKDRSTQFLPPVKLANDLNSIAQAHSQDMIDRNFFGHVNPSGLSPDDRRKNANIPTAIRENLGKATSLELVEAGLMRSPVHRDVIIDPAMTRVGLGIAKNSEGYFFVTENFSSDPLSAADLPGIEDALINDVNNFRTSNGLATFVNDAILKDVSSQWSVRMATEGFFGTTDNQGGTLVSAIRSRGINSSIQMNVVSVSAKDQLKEELLSQDGLKGAGNRKIGLGLALNTVGELFMTVIYTP